MLVQLLYFPGCPNVEVARKTLQQALSGLDDAPRVSEVDVTDPSTPPELRSWGSPTILIDGADVAGGAPSPACCRIYPTSENRGAPSLNVVEAALRAASQRTMA